MSGVIKCPTREQWLGAIISVVVTAILTAISILHPAPNPINTLINRAFSTGALMLSIAALMYAAYQHTECKQLFTP